MAKTCRTCNESVMEPRCYYHQKRFCYRAEDCPHYRQRETPLVVDRLAKMVQLLMSPVGDAISERAEAVCAAKALLEDYQEEVGDAEA